MTTEKQEGVSEEEVSQWLMDANEAETPEGKAYFGYVYLFLAKRAYEKGLVDGMEKSIPVAAALAAAISLLERGGRQASASNKMFEQMLADYRKALTDFRAAIGELNENK